MKFIAQIKQVNARVTQSNDKEFVIKLVTEDPEALKAGLLPPESTVMVNIE